MAGKENGRRMPAVVHVTPDPAGRGGMAAVVRGLIGSELADRYAMSCITTHRRGSTVTRLAVAVTGLVRLAVWCVGHPGGVVHVHSSVRGSLYRKSLAVLISRSFGRPVLLHVHVGPGDIKAFADGLDPISRRLLTWMIGRADMTASVSAASSAAFASAFALDEVGVIPNAAPRPPVDVPAPETTAALFLGGFEDPAKGGTDLVDVLPDLLRADPAVRVTLAGPGEPPPALREIADDRVSWRGWLDNETKRITMIAAGVVIIPARSEGLPMVLLEAMSYGRAVVATRVGGIPDFIDDGVDGLLVDPSDADGLIAAVSRLAGDLALVRSLGAAARDRIAELDERDIVAQLDAVYRTLSKR